MSGKPIDKMVKVALRNLPQYISKSGLVGPDKHSAMLCFEALRDAITAAQQQGQAGGGEVFGWWMTDFNGVGRFVYGADPACRQHYETTPGYSARALYTAPPSAPVGVDKETERRLIDVAASMLNDNNGKIGKKHFRADATAVVRRVLKVLAQQPAAVDEEAP